MIQRLKVITRVLMVITFTIPFPVMAQDADLGEKVYKKCKICHAVGEEVKKRIGPNLNDIFERSAGASEGYKFSDAMREKGQNGLVWNDETLTEFLTKPKSVVPNTKMMFAGMKDSEDIVNIIAYLRTFSKPN